MDAVDAAMYAAKERGKNRIGGPYARAGEMTPVILGASPGAARRTVIPFDERAGRAG